MLRNKDLFKMPNSIFNYKLSATELTVLTALYSLRSRYTYKGYKYVKVNQKTIASLCGFKSTVTVSKAVDKLCRLNLIGIRRYYDDVKRLGAYVYCVPVITNRYFFVNRNIFKYKLTVSQMRMYLFFCKCSESRSKRFWQSYNDICRLLGLKRCAVIKTISELVGLGLIKKYKKVKKNRSYTDNHYKIVSLTIKCKIKRKKRRCCIAHSILKMIGQRKIKPINEIIIIHKGLKVNTYSKIFSSGG